MIQPAVKAQVTGNGHVARNLTTHSTGARRALPSCARLSCYCGSPRPVNSGVGRFGAQLKGEIMLKIDRFLRVLLILLVAGVWSLLLTNVFSAYSSQAQARRQYGVWVADEKGNLVINGDGSAPLTAAGLVRALSETPRQGWRLHSVVFSTNAGGYTVIVER
jgi:hypothetical protein